MLRKVVWTVMALLAFVVAIYAAAALALPGFRPPFVGDLIDRTPLPAFGHLLGGLVAIAAGALQVNSRIRNRFLNFHRWLGRTYVIAVLVGGLSAFALAFRSSGGMAAHFGFGLLAICWLTSTIVAYFCIRRGDEDSHRDWMLRSYGLTLAAVTLRIYLPISQAAGLEFEPAYQTISWLCWVPNLVVVEWLLVRRHGRAAAIA
jgi:uncharacterized membrane protein